VIAKTLKIFFGGHKSLFSFYVHNDMHYVHILSNFLLILPRRFNIAGFEPGSSDAMTTAPRRQGLFAKQQTFFS
jgi:hypothetical protein